MVSYGTITTIYVKSISQWDNIEDMAGTRQGCSCDCVMEYHNSAFASVTSRGARKKLYHLSNLQKAWQLSVLLSPPVNIEFFRTKFQVDKIRLICSIPIITSFEWFILSTVSFVGFIFKSNTILKNERKKVEAFTTCISEKKYQKQLDQKFE